MNRALSSLFVVLVLWSAVARALPTKTCADLLLDVQNQIQSPGTAATLEQSRIEKKPSVAVTDELPGRHGGKLLQVTKTKSSWSSSSTSTRGRYDPQGDPRWFIELVGVEAAKFFGFEVLSEQQMTVPDLTEFSGALQKVNADLKRRNLEPIAIQYYPAAANNYTKVRDYTDRFVKDFGLPMASMGNHLFHDLSFHTGAIFIPRKLLAYKAAQIVYQQAFLSYLRKKYVQAEEQKAISFLEFQLHFGHTQEIDNATGIVGPGLMNYLKDKLPHINADEDIAGFWYSLIPGSDTPTTDLTARIEDIVDGFGLKATPKGIGPHSPVFDRLPLVDELTEFSRSYSSASFPGFNANKPFHIGSEGSMSDIICNQVTQRRKEIVESVLRLMAE